MRLLLFCFFSLFLALSVGAQPRADEYIDVVFLRGGGSVEGTLLAYEFGEEVTIVTEAGGTKTYGWDEIRRVNFRLDKRRLEQIRSDIRRELAEMAELDSEEPVEEEPEESNRKYLHQVSGAISLGENAVSQQGGVFFGDRNVTTFGGSIAYHLVRQTRWLNVGLGVDAAIMSHSRGENILALTGQFEFPLIRKESRVKPFIRAEAGPAIPFGTFSEELEITDRNISALIHPSVGAFFSPGDGKSGGLFVDLGYRFINASFNVVNASLEVSERTAQYRRLYLRGGLRF